MATDAISHDPLGALPVELHPNIDHIITEDGAPVDSLFSEKQMRLLTESLQASWPGPGEGRPFVVMANVGLFFGIRKPPLVPDVLVSIDVQLPESLFPKSSRSYFIWEYGKPPEIVIEVVSNREGGEDTKKLDAYAAIGIPYYVIFDPQLMLSGEIVRVFRRYETKFERISEPFWFSGVDLGIRLWQGQYEDHEGTWLRWFNSKGELIPTGKERADAERDRAEAERARAEDERERANAERDRADAERKRAERLAEQLRKLGIDPNGQ